MTHDAWLELFAWVLLGCVSIILIVDVLTEFSVHIALQFRWSICYNAIRYIGVGCAIALAFDVIH